MSATVVKTTTTSYRFARMAGNGRSNFFQKKNNILYETNENMLRFVTVSMKDKCPFLSKTMNSNNLNDFSKIENMNSSDVSKFITKCPFGRMIFNKDKEISLSEFLNEEVLYNKMENKNMINYREDSISSSLSTLYEENCNEINQELEKSLKNNNINLKKNPMLDIHSKKYQLHQNHFVNTLNKMKEEGNYRKFNHIDRKVGNYPKADNRLDISPSYESNLEALPQKDITVWCNNDYLAMGQHPKVLQTMKQILDNFGAGSGGTRNISGTSSLHVLLERELASLHHKESALLFSSCYVANSTSIPTLIKLLPPGTTIFSDEKNHASLIEGIRNSGAQKKIFRHNDISHLKSLLTEVHPEIPKLIIFESVYSMDGTIAPIEKICDIADEFNAITFVDEVHAVGLYGPHGGGVCEERELLDRVDIISATLGKAFGLYGGYITSTSAIIDSIRSFAPGFIFTTSLPPVIVGGALESVKHLKQSRMEREIQRINSKYLKNRLKEVGLPVMDSESHIVPLLIGDSKLCKKMSEVLLSKYKIYVQPINYPTVPKGTERFRLTPTPVHKKEDIDYLVNSLVELWNEFKPQIKIVSH
jgi:5-aminolevulinate synthase